MTNRDDNGCKNDPPGTRASKNVVFASTEGVDAFKTISTGFMSSVFELEPGDYVMSDESDVLDFMPFDERTTDEVWRRIARLYGVTFADVRSGRLVAIFRAISARHDTQ